MAAIDSGSHLGHYDIRSQLGAGGMGAVYLAQDTRLGRKVALKLLPSAFTKDEGRLRRFQQEARAASALNHPNILTIFEIGEVNGIHFIATELIEGETLRQRMGQMQIRMDEALEVATQAASALAAAHKAGIVHRDIKPDNIMVRNDGYVKLLDFGLAKLIEPEAIDSEGSTLVNTEPGMVLGTAHYMSPEQARGLPIDSRTDIWSLGVVLYEMLSGRLPFQGNTGTDVLAAILEREPATLTHDETEFPTELHWLVKKALRKDRDERYQTARELLSDLKSIKQRLDFMAELERSSPPEQHIGRRDSMSSPQGPVKTAEEIASSTAGLSAEKPKSSAEYIVSEIKQHKKGMIVALALLLIGIVWVGISLYIFIPSRESSKFTAPSQTMKIARLTSSGRASHATVSPDGKYVVHVANENGQQSLQVRQVNTISEVQIVSPADVNYIGLTFSRDADFIYYVVKEKNSPTNTLYRVPVLGGASRRLLGDVGSAVSLSPDGQQLAFIRNFSSEGEQAIIISSAEGLAERKLAVRKLPNFFQSLSWSPDGKSIACAAGSFVPTFSSYLVEISFESGKEKPLSSQTWRSMGQVAWLPDGSGLVLDALDQNSASLDSFQIWYVSYPGGVVRRITNDLNNYGGVSVTADSSRLIAVQSETLSNIWLLPNADESRASQLTTGVGQRDGWSGLAWTPAGKIVYASKASGKDDLWLMNPDGGNRKQLTTDLHIDSQPAASLDGLYILFTSDRAGTPNIWRMESDGSNAKQLTSGSGENYAQATPDGRWVVYTLLGAANPTLWRVSINGGAPQQITDKFTSFPAISPDGKFIACVYGEEQPNSPNKMAVISFEGGEPVKLFSAVSSNWGVVRWLPDGRALTYIATSGGVSNIWSQPVDGGPPRQLTNFKSDQIFWFDWSRDGKQLAVARGTVPSDVVVISKFR